MPNTLILIADDEPLVCTTLVDILREEGYRAESVTSGNAAVEFVKRSAPNIFICDVMMPNLNGIEAAKQVRQLSPDTHIILFSGQAATTGLLDTAEKEGFSFQVLAKPVKPEVLLDIISRELGIAPRNEKY